MQLKWKCIGAVVMASLYQMHTSLCSTVTTLVVVVSLSVFYIVYDWSFNWGHLGTFSKAKQKMLFGLCEKSQELCEFWQSLRVGVPIQLTGTLRFRPMNQCVCLVKKMVMFSAGFLKYATLPFVSHYSSEFAVFLHSCHFGCWLIISSIEFFILYFFFYNPIVCFRWINITALQWFNTLESIEQMDCSLTAFMTEINPRGQLI